MYENREGHESNKKFTAGKVGGFTLASMLNKLRLGVVAIELVQFDFEGFAIRL